MAASLDLRTQAALAKRTGVAQTTISRMIKEQVGVSVDNIESVAIAFDIAACELFGGKPASKNEGDFWMRFESLPAADRDRIDQFIQFTIQQSALSKSDASNLSYIDESGPPSAELREMAIKAAGRSINNSGTKKVSLNYETRQKATKASAAKVGK